MKPTVDTKIKPIIIKYEISLHKMYNIWKLKISNTKTKHNAYNASEKSLLVKS